MYLRPINKLRNGDVTGYVIRYTRADGVSQMITVDGDDRPGLHTSLITGLQAATIYTIEVAAVNINGTGPFSDPVIALSGDDSE